MTRQEIIIFDGPDGCGKTNIGQALSKHIGVPYFKMNTEHENWRKGKFKEALQFDQTYLAEFLKQVGCSVIIDRAYPAEWVYSQVFQRETDMETLRKVDDTFAVLDARIIIPVRRDYSTNREDELVGKEMLPILHKKYMEFRDWSNCSTHVLLVDDYQDNLRLELDAIMDYLKRR